ncbi:MAG: right-handed parallel beta-helix repeat-containing protein [Planctomycetota bacterium]
MIQQIGTADLVGNDDSVLKQACERLRNSGGTLTLGPGRYVIRRSISLPRELVLRGEPGAILALPSPVLTAAPAAAGARAIQIVGPHEFADLIRVQILPPVGTEFFADGVTKTLELVEVERVEGDTLHLRAPLPLDVPAGARLGYPHKLLQLAKEGRATIEGLTFQGGRIEAIPMPGHSQRCAIWASAPWGFELERLGPPGQEIQVRDCTFTDWYGRGVAFYNHENGVVERCTFERIADEAIDLDHYVQYFEVRHNTIRHAPWGIVLNDASRNTIESNHVEDTDIGIYSWMYDKMPRSDLNVENVIRKNTVLRSRQSPIHIDKHCVRYVIEQNEVEGEIVVLEPENTVRENRALPR